MLKINLTKLLPSVGNFRFINDNICNVSYYGYSSLFGKFYTCRTIIQKIPKGFAIKSALYTRGSVPLDRLKAALHALPTDAHS